MSLFNSKRRLKIKKTAIETVTPMQDKDGAWRVSGYYIKWKPTIRGADPAKSRPVTSTFYCHI
jgi:hypothetical protein